MEPVFKFKPISFSWVALHPQPKGVILFVGGAFLAHFQLYFIDISSVNYLMKDIRSLLCLLDLVFAIGQLRLAS